MRPASRSEFAHALRSLGLVVAVAMMLVAVRAHAGLLQVEPVPAGEYVFDAMVLTIPVDVEADRVCLPGDRVCSHPHLTLSVPDREPFFVALTFGANSREQFAETVRVFCPRAKLAPGTVEGVRVLEAQSEGGGRTEWRSCVVSHVSGARWLAIIEHAGSLGAGEDRILGALRASVRLSILSEYQTSWGSECLRVGGGPVACEPRS